MRKGITESIWNNTFVETQRLAWAIFVGVISIFAGFLVKKTGNAYVDAPLSLYLFLNAMLIVHVQRKFSSHSTVWRRRLSRYSVHFFVFGLYFVEVAVFLAVVLEVLRLLVPRLIPDYERLHSTSPAIGWAFIISSSLGLLIGVWLAYRSFDWRRTFVDRPRRFFIRYIFARRLQAISFLQFAAFEIGVVYYTFALCYFIVHLANAIRGTVPL